MGNRLIHKREKAQLGKETTSGTAIAADHALVHPVVLAPDYVIERPQGLRGFTSKNAGDEIISSRMTGVTFPEFPASYEDLGYLLSMGVAGGVTPGQGTWGGTDPSVYEAVFERQRIGVYTPDTYTLESRQHDGTTAVDREATFAFLTGLTMKWLPNGLVTVGASGVAQQIEASILTALTPGAIEQIIGKRTKVFIDGSIANLGNTEFGGEVISASLTFNPGFAPLRTLTAPDTFLEYDDVVWNPDDSTFKLDLTVLAKSGAADLWLTQVTRANALTVQAIRIENEGSIIGETSTFTKRLQVDMFGRHEKGSPWISGEQDGQKIVNMSFVDTTGSMVDDTDPWFAMRLRNLISSY